MHFVRRAVLADERVDHLARLIERAQHHGVTRDVHVLVEFHPPIFIAPGIERRQVFVFAFADLVQLAVVVARLLASFVVAQPRFHVRQDVVERLEGKVAEFVESDGEQRIHHLRLVRQIEFAEFTFDFFIFFVHGKHPSDIVE